MLDCGAISRPGDPERDLQVAADKVFSPCLYSYVLTGCQGAVIGLNVERSRIAGGAGRLELLNCGAILRPGEIERDPQVAADKVFVPYLYSYVLTG